MEQDSKGRNLSFFSYLELFLLRVFGRARQDTRLQESLSHFSMISHGCSNEAVGQVIYEL